MNWLWAISIALVLGLSVVVSHLRQLTIQNRRFEAWAKRDAELTRRFWEAYSRADCDGMQAIRYQISKNWEAYKGWME